MTREPFILAGAVDDLEARLRDDRPAHLTIEPPTWRDELADDWRSFIGEVRSSPASHALVAIFTVIAWTLLLYGPFLFGWLK